MHRTDEVLQRRDMGNVVLAAFGAVHPDPYNFTPSITSTQWCASRPPVANVAEQLEDDVREATDIQDRRIVVRLRRAVRLQIDADQLRVRVALLEALPLAHRRRATAARVDPRLVVRDVDHQVDRAPDGAFSSASGALQLVPPPPIDASFWALVMTLSRRFKRSGTTSCSNGSTSASGSCAGAPPPPAPPRRCNAPPSSRPCGGR